MTKIPSLVLAGSLFLALVAPAFAVSKITNLANINSTVSSSANTGYNVVNGSSSHHHSSSGGNTILTGVAGAGAGSYVDTVNSVNSTSLTLPKVNNTANINSTANASANSGYNTINGGSNNFVQSGDASASSTSSVSNVNVVGFSGGII